MPSTGQYTVTVITKFRQLRSMVLGLKKKGPTNSHMWMEEVAIELNLLLMNYFLLTDSRKGGAIVFICVCTGETTGLQCIVQI